MSKPICGHCVAEVQLFKQCPNLTAGHCAAGVQLFKRCQNLSARTVLQRCSCLSGVETYLPALCCRGSVRNKQVPTCSPQVEFAGGKLSLGRLPPWQSEILKLEIIFFSCLS